LYNTLAVAIPLNGSEIWALRRKGQKSIDISGDEIFQKNSRVRPFLTTQK
jgi:hypothetical protein